MKKNNSGFTLVEVMLVLAIAGLIFAGVFVALRSLWANERDSKRKDDVLTFIRQLKNYQSNNARGALPTASSLPLWVSGDSVAEDRSNKVAYQGNTSWGVFYRDYFRDSFEDPDGQYYNLWIRECDNSANSVSQEASCPSSENDTEKSAEENRYALKIVIGAACGAGENDVVKSANKRNVAVVYDLETGGYYCEDTQ